MSFIGSDGLDRQIKHLKQQVSERDAQLTSLQNEMRKKEEDSAESKRAAETALFKLQTEADRADKAEKAATTAKIELSKLQLQHANLETSHRSTQDELKSMIKENKKLDDQLDWERSTASAGSSRQQQGDAKMQARMKDLERELERERLEKAKLEDQVKSMRTSTSSALSSPARPQGGRNRRRASSVNSSNQIQDLQAEIEALRSDKQSDLASLDMSKTQLTNVKRDMDKLVNEKMALEKRHLTEVADLKSKVEDLTFEVEDLRRFAEQGSGGDDQKATKALTAVEAECAQLRSKIASLKDKIAEKDREIEALESVEPAPAQGARTCDHEDEIKTLRAQVQSLETDLADRSTANTSSSADKSTRQLQRENERLRKQLEDVDEQLSEKEDEIAALRRTIPLPSSPILKPVSDTNDLENKVSALEEELESVGKRLQQNTFDNAEKVRDLEKTVDTLEAECAAVRDELQGEKQAHAIYREEMEAFTARRNSFEAEMEQVRDELAIKEAAVAELESKVVDLQNEVEKREQALVAVKEELAAAVSARDEVQSALAEKSSILEAETAIRQELSQQLSTRSHDDSEFDGLKAQIAMREEQLLELQVKLEGAEAARQEIGLQEFGVRQERDVAKEELEAMRTTMAMVEDEHCQRMIEREQALTVMTAQLEEAAALALSHQSRINELEEEVANRSSESIARERDVQLIELGEEVATLKAALQSERELREKEVESATFVASQDATEHQAAVVRLEARVFDLEQQLQTATIVSKAEMKRFEQMTVTIQRLRSERDEAKSSLRFVEKERYFIVASAEEERVKALASLESVRSDLDQQSSLIDKLASEKSDLQQRLAEASNVVAQADDTEKITHLESEIARINAEKEDAHTRSASLETRVAAAEETLNKAEQEHQEAMRDLNSQLALEQGRKRDAERRVSLFLVDKKRESATTAVASPKVSEMSSRSELAFARQREAALDAQLSRRTARLQNLENDYKKLELNKQMMEESVKEMSEEIEEMRTTHDELESRVVQQTAVIESTRQQLDEARAQLQVALENAAGVPDATSDDDLQSVVLTLALHGRAYSAASKKMDSVSVDLVAARTELEAARAENAVLLEELASADGVRDALEESKSGLAAAEKKLLAAAAVEAELGQVKDARAMLETKISGLGSDVASASERLTAAQKAHEAAVADLKAKLGEVRAESETAKLELVTSAERIEQLITERDEALSRLARADSDGVDKAQLESQIADLTAKLTDVSAAQEKSVAQVAEIQAAHAAMKDESSRQVNEHAERIEELTRAHGEVEAKLVKARAEVAEKEAKVGEVQNKATELEKEAKRATGLVKFHESQNVSLTTRMKQVEESLVTAKQQLATAENTTKALRQELSLLEGKNERLKTELADAASAKPDESVQDLQERINALEQSLHTKTLEVDETDDKVLYLTKEVTKLQKKIAKLDRINAKLADENNALKSNNENLTVDKKQLETLNLTLKNTLDNSGKYSVKSGSTTTSTVGSTMAPPPVPTTTTPRAPLRNVFEPAGGLQQTPSTGNKRPREDGELKMPAEVRMQPSTLINSTLGLKSSLTSSTTTTTPKVAPGVKSAFTPSTRPGAENVFMPTSFKEPPPSSVTRGNVFGGTGASGLGSGIKNAFADPGVNETPVPLRNIFRAGGSE